MIDKQVVVATKCRAAKRVGGFLTKYQVAIIYQFYRSVLYLNELLPHGWCDLPLDQTLAVGFDGVIS